MNRFELKNRLTIDSLPPLPEDHLAIAARAKDAIRSCADLARQLSECDPTYYIALAAVAIAFGQKLAEAEIGLRTIGLNDAGDELKKMAKAPLDGVTCGKVVNPEIALRLDEIEVEVKRVFR